MRWDMILSFFGMAVVWLFGSNRPKAANALGIFSEVLWIAYGVSTEQWWFVASAFVFALLFARGLVKEFHDA